jgi:hypothetical protein
MRPAGGDDRDAFAEWLADARVEEEVAARSRVRRLVEQASEEGTLVAALLDLAERSATVRIDTVAGRSFHGTIAAVGRDVVAVAGPGPAALVALGAIVAVATADAGARPPTTARPTTRTESLHTALGDLSAERALVGLVVTGGRDEVVTGTLVAVGTDVVTLRTDGAPGRTLYVALTSVVAALLPSG